MSYDLLTVRREGPAEHVELNRSRVRNALNAQLVAELTRWAAGAAADRSIRVGVIRGAGAVFCAGGDLSWMAGVVNEPAAANQSAAGELAAVFEVLDALPMPLIGRIHGAALGAGAGLAAVCDIVVADEQTVFGFPEVKHGLVPSVITPYVLAKIGRSAARELFLTGAPFGAARAREIGLVHAVVPNSALDATVDGYVRELAGGGPAALASAKAMIGRVWPLAAGEAGALTVELLAACRASAEAQEGMRAFLEKRRPRWAGHS